MSDVFVPIRIALIESHNKTYPSRGCQMKQMRTRPGSKGKVRCEIINWIWGMIAGKEVIGRIRG